MATPKKTPTPAPSSADELEVLATLLSEKRKYDGYLTRLAEHRANTPDHVFQRLHDEYLTRQMDAQVRAAAVAESLVGWMRHEEASVAAADEKRRAIQDDIVEGELRAAVGELDPGAWQEQRTTLSEALTLAERDREERQSAVQRTRGLMEEALGADALREAVLAAQEAETQASNDAAVGSPSASTAAAAATSPTPAPQVVPPVAATPASVPAPQVPSPTAAGAPGSPMPPSRAAAPARVPPVDEFAVLERALATRPLAPMTSPSASPRQPVAPPVPNESSASGTGGSSRSSRPAPGSGQPAKTLKCGDCGSMNYPSEWYCERCGGELAAL